MTEKEKNMTKERIRLDKYYREEGRVKALSSVDSTYFNIDYSIIIQLYLNIKTFGTLLR